LGAGGAIKLGCHREHPAEVVATAGAGFEEVDLFCSWKIVASAAKLDMIRSPFLCDIFIFFTGCYLSNALFLP
jgi:hypothetical protein